MKELKLPDPVCGSICKLSMSEKCIDVCVPKGEMELLQVREDMTIDRMPRYRKREDLKWKARVRLNEAYTEKICDYLQGVRHTTYVNGKRGTIYTDF